MINDMDLAIAVTQRFNHNDVVVSKKVLFEALSKLVESGNGYAKINLRQDNLRYPYLHKVLVDGVLFIHCSREELCDTSISEAEVR